MEFFKRLFGNKDEPDYKAKYKELKRDWFEVLSDHQKLINKNISLLSEDKKMRDFIQYQQKHLDLLEDKVAVIWKLLEDAGVQFKKIDERLEGMSCEKQDVCIYTTTNNN